MEAVVCFGYGRLGLVCSSCLLLLFLFFLIFFLYTKQVQFDVIVSWKCLNALGASTTQLFQIDSRSQLLFKKKKKEKTIKTENYIHMTDNYYFFFSCLCQGSWNNFWIFFLNPRFLFKIWFISKRKRKGKKKKYSCYLFIFFLHAYTH